MVQSLDRFSVCGSLWKDFLASPCEVQHTCCHHGVFSLMGEWGSGASWGSGCAKPAAAMMNRQGTGWGLVVQGCGKKIAILFTNWLPVSPHQQECSQKLMVG